MSLFILDTDTLSLAQHGQPTVLAAILHARADGHTVAITTVSVEEQAKGWITAFQKARNHAHRARVSQRLSDAVPVWAAYSPLPQTEASLAGFDALVSMKLNVGRMDLRIASVALELGATVVTHNRRDFERVPGLLLTDWTLPPAHPQAPA